MITTTSGIHLEEGVIANQCLDGFISTEEQNTGSIYQDSPHAEDMVETFAFPSHHIMQGLLALFSGKTRYLPEKYLFGDEQPSSENRRIQKFVDSVLLQTIVKNTYNEFNELIRRSEQIAIVSNSPLVDGHVKIPQDIFVENLEKREEELAFYIRKTFGAEGLRHFLGLIIGLEENGRHGEYHFTLSEHLARLGYKRSKKGSYDPALKVKAFRIIDVLSSLHLTLSYRNGTKKKKTVIRLFSLDRYDAEQRKESCELINMTFVVRANDLWYRHAFQKTDTRSQQYTQLLKKITTENHLKHSLAIYLAVKFAIGWRINKFNPTRLKVSTLMEWCELDWKTSNKNRMRDLKNLEAELAYMVSENYLGDWCGSKTQQILNQFNEVLQFAPPSWLGASMKRKIQPNVKMRSTITVEGLKWVQEQTSMSQKELAEKLGVSRQHINNILKGRSRISSKLSQKITEEFGYVLEKVSTKPCPT